MMLCSSHSAALLVRAEPTRARARSRWSRLQGSRTSGTRWVPAPLSPTPFLRYLFIPSPLSPNPFLRYLLPPPTAFLRYVQCPLSPISQLFCPLSPAPFPPSTLFLRYLLPPFSAIFYALFSDFPHTLPEQCPVRTTLALY
eukprot:316326-Rhodomonas_salina.2